MEKQLLYEVLGRLDSEVDVEEEISSLVLAALLDELDGWLNDGEISERPPETESPPPTPARTTIRSLTVQGFRGIGSKVKLELPTGAGLTLVVGKNGSGKSSFAEALEQVFTGDNHRWSSRRAKQWREGWRNLHHSGASGIAAELEVDGEAGSSLACCTWGADDDLDDADAFVKRDGERSPMESLGWQDSIVAYRPFLSYNELARMLDEGPTKLFDTLASILGLDELTESAKRLASRRLEISAEHKRVAAGRAELLESLAGVEDERATAVATALAGKKWNLEAIRNVVDQDRTVSPEDAAVRALNELLALPLPSIEDGGRAVKELRDALEQVRSASGTDAGRALQVADILERAVRLHADHGDTDCPVCHTPDRLSARWSKQAGAESGKLRKAAGAATAAIERLQRAERLARAFARPLPPVLDLNAGHAMDCSAARSAWSKLHSLASVETNELVELLGKRLAEVLHRVGELQDSARGELARRQDAWRPLGDALRAWLPDALPMQSRSELVKQLQAAEKWIKTSASEIRNARFAPIAERVKSFWSQLRTNSSVELTDVAFEGTATRRRINLGVAVDGAKGGALGVMSQGELHALALSLFLPRATLDASPFGFVVLDDPVQAMDAERVDGLARVLESVGKERQVIVFSHDDRLPESVSRLGIPATLIEVRRRAGSVVEVLYRQSESSTG